MLDAVSVEDAEPESDGEGLSDAVSVEEELLVGPGVSDALNEAEAETDLLGDMDGVAEAKADARSIMPAALKGASESTRGRSYERRAGLPGCAVSADRAELMP